MTFATIRSEFDRSSASVSPFDQAEPSSPAAYDAIGKLILGAYLDSIEEIDELGLPYHHNLGVALYCELHTRACYHYYREYDRLQGLTALPAPHEIRRSKRSLQDLVAGARRRLSDLITIKPKSEWGVAFAGTTTFPWQALRRELAKEHVSLRRGSTGPPLALPKIHVQAATLRAWAHRIHAEIPAMLHVTDADIAPYGPDPITPLLKRMADTPSLSDDSPELLVTGTLGDFSTRMTAIAAMARGIPILTFHHGAQFMIWDEPYYELYEGSLPDFKIVYGDTRRQFDLGATTNITNIRTSAIQLYARTDATIRRLYTGESIPTLENLSGKNVLYLASEFESVRYGPYRDVHPSTYMDWQQKLLAWIQSQSGVAPSVRLHPKRPSTHFDPQGYPLSDGDLTEEIGRADVLVVDYPTTSLAIAAATTKPLLYFNLGIRHLFPAADAAITDRCMAAMTNILNPTDAFAAMEANMGRACDDTFTPLFSLAPDGGEEVSDSAKAIAKALALN